MIFTLLSPISRSRAAGFGFDYFQQQSGDVLNSCQVQCSHSGEVMQVVSFQG